MYHCDCAGIPFNIHEEGDDEVDSEDDATRQLMKDDFVGNDEEMQEGDCIINKLC